MTMAFDIYGCYLKPGHCEVHPDVPELFPCYLCYQEKQAQYDDYESIREVVARMYEREQERTAPICSSCDRPIEGEVYPGNVCFSCFRRWDP